MTNYGRYSDKGPGRVASCIAVVVLHLLIFYVVARATGITVVRGNTILHMHFIPLEKPKELPPPPPPPSTEFPENSIIQIVTPEIRIAAPAEKPPLPNTLITKPAAFEDNELVPQMDLGPITKPRAISKPHTSDFYPPESVRLGETGRTEMMICISERGEVNSARVSRSSGFPRLDRAAIGMAYDYRFTPAIQHGAPVAICLRYGIRFDIDGVTATPAAPRSVKPAEDDCKRNDSRTSTHCDVAVKTVPMQTYLDEFERHDIKCDPIQLRVIEQEQTTQRYVIEAQCSEQPGGLVAFVPVDGNNEAFESMDCLSAAKRQITCEFTKN